MIENLALLFRFYYRPARAASDAVDTGSLPFSIAITGLVMLLWVFGGPVRYVLAVVPHESPTLLSFVLPAISALSSPRSLVAILALFLAMLPVSIAVLATWQGLGSASVVLRREYVAMLVCGLLSWSAAYLLFGVLNVVLPIPGLPFVAHLSFLVLFVVCLRTALGVRTAQAALAAFVGWLAALCVLLLWPFVGGMSYLLLSPWLLFLLYRYYAPDVRSLGDVMTSRRNFRRQLEASMLNPQDADAHYQLGLIYEQRRQYDLAAESFRRAVQIHPDEAESQLHLARMLRSQGKREEALPHIEAALRADSSVSLQEGWRDLGITLLELGRAEEGLSALEKYVDRRSYDPEGLFHYASALRALGRTDEAREAYTRTIDAVETAPKYRRGQLRRWANQAKSELRTLK